MHDITPFSGSYLPDDIQFLLKPIQIEMTPVEVKEKLIHQGPAIILTCSVRSQRRPSITSPCLHEHSIKGPHAWRVKW